jgi:hypothetical protein
LLPVDQSGFDGGIPEEVSDPAAIGRAKTMGFFLGNKVEKKNFMCYCAMIFRTLPERILIT